MAYATKFIPNPAQPVDVQIFYYRGNGNGYTNTNFWLRSGIGIMKFVSPDDTAVGKINDRITKNQSLQSATQKYY